VATQLIDLYEHLIHRGRRYVRSGDLSPGHDWRLIATARHAPNHQAQIQRHGFADVRASDGIFASDRAGRRYGQPA